MDLRTLDLTDQMGVVFGAELLVQRVRVHLGMFLSEWFLDPGRGLPWIDWLGSRTTKTKDIMDVLTAEVLSVDGVQRVTDLSVTKQDVTWFIRGRIYIDDENAGGFPFGVGLQPQGVGRVRVF